ncbi:MAG: tRNA glutamyl-Q(34) synthetase GluQRS [Roseitalea sp.]|nr:tRNA glutamyl-Q(34) synthetase GluQRS [Roseitalea sp.]MBO6722614.1 tRNA glutamyl-Q(34) synthetase GluQRS [Roseitalea sp.]MBO6745097.1 tRNA glutamyl-Q(34) synthetase GluQRS [Roseitalea sp.]
MVTPVFRFAPSPNGLLHLGHAYSALLNFDMARAAGGRFLLRIEDIDTARCMPALEARMLEDLRWLGLEWEEPVRRQSEHFDDYRRALDALADAGLAYRSAMSRGDIRRFVEAREAEGAIWPHDPDGAPLFPGRDHEDGPDARSAWRLDVAAALDHLRNTADLGWMEQGAGPDGETGWQAADPSAWGDFVLARRDTPTSYHLSVVIDDAQQGITHVVRGRDLFAATSAHVLLQELLGLLRPAYHHHDLVMDEDGGRKLSKSRGDTALAALRSAGATPADIRRMVGLPRDG